MARSKINISSINWGSTPSGSAAGGGSFLVLNSDGRVVLAEGGGGGVADVDVISGSSATYHTISGSTGKFNLLDVDRISSNQINTVSLTGSGGMMIGNANSDDLSILAGLITDLVPQNDSKVDLGTSSKQFAEAHIDTGYIDVITASYARITSLDVDVMASRTVTKESLEIKDNLIIAGVSGSIAGNFIGAGFQIGGTVGVQGTGSNPLMSLTLGSRTLTGDSMIINVDGQAGASFKSGSVTQAALGKAGMRFGVTGSISGSLLQGKKAEIGSVSVNHISGNIVSAQRLNVYGEISGSGTNTLIKKNHIHRNIVQNNSNSHGGLSFESGRLSVGWRKLIFVRSDGSNISGSIPTKGMFADKAVPTPYTTASLGAQSQSGSMMVYLNGILLHGDHPGQNSHGPTSADYRVVTASNAYKVLLNEELAMESDDILTVTYLSGSGVNS